MGIKKLFTKISLRCIIQSMQRRRNTLWFIIALTFLCLLIDIPKNFPIKFQVGNIKVNKIISGPDLDFTFAGIKVKRPLEIKQGLDLKGGTHLVLQADMKGLKASDRDTALEAAKNVIERRINFYGVAEPVIQSSKIGENYRIIVELPGISNVNQAIDLIGKTAQLNFRELEATFSAEATSSANLFGPFTTLSKLSGKHLKKSEVTFDNNTGKPLVSLEFNSEGATLFGEITKNNIGKQVAIFLDNQLVSAPTVEEEISGGNAVIRGDFTLDEAKRLSIQLNAGALPVPVKIIEQRTIGATLGKESVEKSIRGGFIGLSMVLFFMWAYYGKLGLLADFALIIYGIITLALYKIIPITLTLPGVAGFILSIGMAVDSNILIFERMKEELRSGKHWQTAMELGFGRAWDSIRDANVTTLITCFILFNPFNWSFLNSSGMVRGFALTLSLGIFISLFTGIVVTRTLLRIFYKPNEKKHN